MNDPVENTVPDPTPGADPIRDLVGDWLDWAARAEALGVTVSKVRQLIKEHQLAAVVPAPAPVSRSRPGWSTPARSSRASGLCTVLHDGEYSDHEIITWLYTPDETLPGRPIDALRENRGSEVKRRAQAMAL